ncbi:MAG: methyl-accepting chemotaxis protein, partial [Oscillospiraceae bacterium]|nr:methyl-accepting chemotaxis protein [Oscillospiraceae bacterium]
MTGKQADSPASQGIKRSLNGRILRNTTLNILILVAICCTFMALSMQSLANNILLDSLQPMARQSAKTVEANIHMLADRMMTIASDPRMNAVAVSDGTEISRPDTAATAENRQAVLEEAAEIYELYTIALY